MWGNEYYKVTNLTNFEIFNHVNFVKFYDVLIILQVHRVLASLCGGAN